MKNNVDPILLKTQKDVLPDLTHEIGNRNRLDNLKSEIVYKLDCLLMSKSDPWDPSFTFDTQLFRKNLHSEIQKEEEARALREAHEWGEEMGEGAFNTSYIDTLLSDADIIRIYEEVRGDIESKDEQAMKHARKKFAKLLDSIDLNRIKKNRNNTTAVESPERDYQIEKINHNRSVRGFGWISNGDSWYVAEVCVAQIFQDKMNNVFRIMGMNVSPKAVTQFCEFVESTLSERRKI